MPGDTSSFTFAAVAAVTISPGLTPASLGPVHKAIARIVAAALMAARNFVTRISDHRDLLLVPVLATSLSALIRRRCRLFSLFASRSRHNFGSVFAISRVPEPATGLQT